ncbi:MAG: putative sugar nucleotidyl transferase [Pirellulaceae bacterium]
MNIILFEDARVADLDPVTTGRPAFAVSCGSFRLIDLIRHLSDQDVRLITRVRTHLRDVVAADFPHFQDTLDPAHQWTCCINARVAPAAASLSELGMLVGRRESLMITDDDDQLLAAVVPTATISSPELPELDTATFESLGCTRIDSSLEVIQYLHDLIRVHCDSMTANLQWRLGMGGYREIADGVFSADDASLGEHVVTDTRHGPIVLESGCNVGPFTFLEGPVYLGTHCKIAAHSAIKDGVSAGSTCKLGGEIEATIVESYTNKQHYGFLGHSYLGSWINLGAGTCNSDLKNTYGKVNMQHGGEKIATGLQFCGCFVGDYAKTAINTSIYTGKTIGVGSMVYGMAVHNVAAFTNDARLTGKVTAIDPKVMIATQARMFGRRQVEQRPCDKALIEAMFELTAAERSGLSCEPLVW